MHQQDGRFGVGIALHRWRGWDRAATKGWLQAARMGAAVFSRCRYWACRLPPIILTLRVEIIMGHNSLCSMAYFTNSANEVMLSFCIKRALWVLMVLLLSANC